MRIAISATGPSLNSEIDPRFGRSEYFVVVDPETMQLETLRNPNLGAASGAGISTAQLICNQGVGAVLTGSIGPKAHQVLSTAGVRMLTGVSGKIDDAIAMFKSGMLVERADAGTGPGMGSRSGPGSAKGGGQGMAMRLGMGRRMGCGGGGGGGKGMGMGMGRGGASGRRSVRDWEAEPWNTPTDAGGNLEDIAFLKNQAQNLAEELGRIQQRIEQMEKK
jgi:predicted Fe-Mo cluster-binding NifX family protein